MNSASSIIASAVILLGLVTAASATITMYVKPNGTGDGSSWENAAGEPSAAITALSELMTSSGEDGVLKFSEGAYMWANSNSELPSNLKILGGYFFDDTGVEAGRDVTNHCTIITATNNYVLSNVYWKPNGKNPVAADRVRIFSDTFAFNSPIDAEFPSYPHPLLNLSANLPGLPPGKSATNYKVFIIPAEARNIEIDGLNFIITSKVVFSSETTECVTIRACRFIGCSFSFKNAKNITLEDCFITANAHYNTMTCNIVAPTGVDGKNTLRRCVFYGNSVNSVNGTVLYYAGGGDLVVEDSSFLSNYRNGTEHTSVSTLHYLSKGGSLFLNHTDFMYNHTDRNNSNIFIARDNTAGDVSAIVRDCKFIGNSVLYKNNPSNYEQTPAVGLQIDWYSRTGSSQYSDGVIIENCYFAENKGVWPATSHNADYIGAKPPRIGLIIGTQFSMVNCTVVSNDFSECDMTPTRHAMSGVICSKGLSYGKGSNLAIVNCTIADNMLHAAQSGDIALFSEGANYNSTVKDPFPSVRIYNSVIRSLKPTAIYFYDRIMETAGDGYSPSNLVIKSSALTGFDASDYGESCVFDDVTTDTRLQSKMLTGKNGIPQWGIANYSSLRTHCVDIYRGTFYGCERQLFIYNTNADRYEPVLYTVPSVLSDFPIEGLIDDAAGAQRISAHFAAGPLNPRKLVTGVIIR